MNKKFFFSLIMIALVWSVQADTVQAFMMGDLFLPRDAGFKEMYGDSQIQPSFQLQFWVIDEFYAYGGFTFKSNTGESGVLHLPTDSKSNVLSGGLGYSVSLSKKLGGFVQAGVGSVHYEERAFDLETTGKKLAFECALGLRFKVMKIIVALVKVGYRSANDRVNNVELKLGGFSSGIGLGFVF